MRLPRPPWSVLLDIQICLRTILIVLGRKSAY